MTEFEIWFGMCVISAVISYLMVLPLRRQVRAMKSMLEMLVKRKREDN